MHSVPQLITAPASEPITLAEAKEHLRVDFDEDDTLITSLIVAAREHLENSIARRLVTQTWEVTYPEFKDELILPETPLQSITSVTYLDSDGDSQTLASTVYEADTTTEPGLIRRTYLQTWPVTRAVWNAVVIRYVVGYGTASDVPQALKQAMYLHIGTMYEFRESVMAGMNVATVPMAYESLISPYRVWYLP